MTPRQYLSQERDSAVLGVIHVKQSDFVRVNLDFTVISLYNNVSDQITVD